MGVDEKSVVQSMEHGQKICGTTHVAWGTNIL